MRIDGDRTDTDLPPPALGEHTEEVLEALALDGPELERLRSAGVVG
jgi:crotonobetainyl-CoA:carnitine CoA-transferase CaiB-like acyl-CoA transferase